MIYLYRVFDDTHKHVIIVSDLVADWHGKPLYDFLCKKFNGSLSGPETNDAHICADRIAGPRRILSLLRGINQILGCRRWF
jgi:hypothetical protein